MAVFSVILLRSPADFEERVATGKVRSSMQLTDDTWLVSSDLTAIDLANELGIGKGGSGSGVVLSTSSYYGRAATSVWDWMKTELEAANG